MVDRAKAEKAMHYRARMTSSGRVTIPKAVRDTLGLAAGDTLVFRVDGNHATGWRVAPFLSLAGSLAPPVAKRNTAWDEVIGEVRAARAAKHR